MNLLEYIYLKKKKWYHATTLRNWEKICKYGIRADINRSKELDFGYGFYLSHNYRWAKKYGESLLQSINGTAEDIDEDVNEIVIIEFSFCPWDMIKKGGFSHKYWSRNSKKFAEFVFNCRMYPGDERSEHRIDVVAGAMTDGNQITTMQDFKEGKVSKQYVYETFMEPTGDYQLLLHNQKVCDMISPNKVTTLKGADLDVTAYKVQKTC